MRFSAKDPLNSAFLDGGVLHRTYAVSCLANHPPHTRDVTLRLHESAKRGCGCVTQRELLALPSELLASPSELLASPSESS
jgi:hypothetical protein